MFLIWMTDFLRRQMERTRAILGIHVPQIHVGALLLDHHFGRLDDHGDSVADFESHFFDAAPGNDAFDFVIADLDYDMGHDVA